MPTSDSSRSDLNLAELDRLERKASAGKWENVRPGGVPPGIVCDIGEESWDITDDAEFIAVACNQLRLLLGLVDRMGEALEAIPNQMRKPELWKVIRDYQQAKGEK